MAAKSKTQGSLNEGIRLYRLKRWDLALAEFLGGGGTPNIELALRELAFQPLYAAYRRLLYDIFPLLEKGIFRCGEFSKNDKIAFDKAVKDFAIQAKNFGDPDDCEETAALITARLEASARVYLSLKKSLQ